MAKRWGPTQGRAWRAALGREGEEVAGRTRLPWDCVGGSAGSLHKVALVAILGFSSLTRGKLFGEPREVSGSVEKCIQCPPL